LQDEILDPGVKLKLQVVEAKPSLLSIYHMKFQLVVLTALLLSFLTPSRWGRGGEPLFATMILMSLAMMIPFSSSGYKS
jgi:hypothetical protein